MKPKLIIVSDLWGISNASWLNTYKKLLNPHFDIEVYDSNKLAGIKTDGLNKEQIHAEFIEYGIAKAVENLVESEKEPVNILGFSIGGTIAWQAGLKELKIIHLFAVSSTRLRYETKIPTKNINLFFGEKDPFRPTEKWASLLNLKVAIIKEGNHATYKNLATTVKVCEHLRRTIINK